MTTDDMFAFQTIVKYNSVSKAAEELFVTQSTLSQRLKALEDELGVTLFERKKGGKQFLITEEGEKLAEKGEKWSSLYEETTDTLMRPVLPTLAIGCSLSTSASVLQYVLFDFIQQQEALGNRIFPKVFSTIYSECYSLLEKGELDFGFCSMIIPSKSVVATPIFQEPLVFVCSRGSNYPVVVDPATLLTSDEIYIGKPGKACYTADLTEWHNKLFSDQPAPAVFTINYPNLSSYFIRPNAWAILPYSVAYPALNQGSIELRECRDVPLSRVTCSLHNKNFPLTPLYEPLIDNIGRFVNSHPEYKFEMVI